MSSPNMNQATPKPPFRKMNWLPRDIAVERHAHGVIVLKSRIPLQPFAVHIPALLARWAIQVWSGRSAVAAHQLCRGQGPGGQPDPGPAGPEGA
jgi:hypothetical protein